VWAWWYYGSPIPQTIIAKSGGMPDIGGVSYVVTAPFRYLTGNSAMIDLLNPTYRYLGGWPRGLIAAEHALAIIAGFLWIVPGLPRVGRITSFALFLGSFYLQAIPPSPWYFPVWGALAAITLGTAAKWLSSNNPGSLARSSIRGAMTVVSIVLLATIPLAAWEMREQQLIIEDHGRQKIGEWLADHGEPDDTVFLEPMGYIGYFSQLHILDYPGLSAPSVVSAMREVGPTFASLIRKLRPTWLVLRPRELAGHGFNQSDILQQYEFVKGWDARSELERRSFLPGRGWLEVDAVFLVFHRRHNTMKQQSELGK